MIVKTFETLRNRLFTKEQNQRLKPIKKWFCSRCLKTYESMDDRFERSCPNEILINRKLEKCSKRLVIYFKLNFDFIFY